MNWGEMENKLAQRLTAKRYVHSLGVSETAVSLAQRFGAAVEKARLAGLLHDCAREIATEALLPTAEALGIMIDDIERRAPILLHAKLGALMVVRDYGVMDREIGQAIAWHTTGGPTMTILDKIIYLADFIEPSRSFPGVERLRELSEKNLNQALLAAYDQSVTYILAKGGLLHPDTIAGRNELLIR
jgi:predicted HD superfamily hydrolase involved in NAD metabolism